MSEFFSMGGYAFFVWPSYLLALVLLVGLLLTSIRAARTRAALLDRLKAERRAFES